VEGRRERGERRRGARWLHFLKLEKGERGVGVCLAQSSGGEDEGGGTSFRGGGRGSSDRQRRATGGGGGQSGDAARTGEMEGGVWSRGSVREEQ
jgi:hypothetical protein